MLFKREQEIFDHLWKNTKAVAQDLGRKDDKFSRQVEALARALAVELAGLERKLGRETTGFDPHAHGHYGKSDS